MWPNINTKYPTDVKAVGTGFDFEHIEYKDDELTTRCV